MRSVRIFSLIGLMWMFMLGVNAQGVEKVKAGDAMPAFSLNSEVYGKVTPADLKGKVVLVFPVCYLVRSLSVGIGSGTEGLVAEIQR